MKSKEILPDEQRIRPTTHSDQLINYHKALEAAEAEVRKLQKELEETRELLENTSKTH